MLPTSRAFHSHDDVLEIKHVLKRKIAKVMINIIVSTIDAIVGEQTEFTINHRIIKTQENELPHTSSVSNSKKIS